MINLENYLDKFPENFVIFGVDNILKQIHAGNKIDVFKLVRDKVHISTYYYWLNGKSPIPLKYLRNLQSIDENIMEKIYKEFTFISSRRVKCVLPKVIGKKLSYLIGVIHGDGSIDKSRRYVTITCESREYLEKILKPIIKDVFDYTPKTYDMDRGKYYRLIIGNKVINHFFSLFSPVGNKKGKIKIPKIVLKNKKLLISYLSGLFDTDGCLSNVEKGTKSLFFVFLQADKRFVEDVSAALKRLNISNRIYKFPSPSKPGEINRDLIEWRIYIGSKKILRDFLIKIPFHHPLKNKRREIILKIL